jgi:hypothetical protein
MTDQRYPLKWPEFICEHSHSEVKYGAVETYVAKA